LTVLQRTAGAAFNSQTARLFLDQLHYLFSLDLKASMITRDQTPSCLGIVLAALLLALEIPLRGGRPQIDAHLRVLILAHEVRQSASGRAAHPGRTGRTRL
jgi:hypothetical protein